MITYMVETIVPRLPGRVMSSDQSKGWHLEYTCAKVACNVLLVTPLQCVATPPKFRRENFRGMAQIHKIRESFLP